MSMSWKCRSKLYKWNANNGAYLEYYLKVACLWMATNIIVKNMPDQGGLISKMQWKFKLGKFGAYTRRCLRAYVHAYMAALLLTPLFMLSESGTVSASAVTKNVSVNQIGPIFDVAVDSSNPKFLFIAGASGFYRVDTDGSATRLSADVRRMVRVVPDIRQANVLYGIGRVSGAGRYRFIVSDDSGLHWRPVVLRKRVGRMPRYFDVSRKLPHVLYGVGPGFWMSDDTGRTWHKTNLDGEKLYDVAASTMADGTVYVGTDKGITISRDGGLSWPEVLDGLCRQPVTAMGSSEGVLYAFSLCKGLIRVDESSGEWEVVNDKFRSCIIQHLAVDLEDSNKVHVVTGCRRVLSSFDGGRTWRDLGTGEIAILKCKTNQFAPEMPTNHLRNQ